MIVSTFNNIMTTSHFFGSFINSQKCSTPTEHLFSNCLLECGLSTPGLEIILMGRAEVWLHVVQIIRGAWKSSKNIWRCRGLNPGPFTCKANALPLRYIPYHKYWAFKSSIVITVNHPKLMHNNLIRNVIKLLGPFLFKFVMNNDIDLHFEVIMQTAILFIYFLCEFLCSVALTEDWPRPVWKDRKLIKHKNFSISPALVGSYTYMYCHITSTTYYTPFNKWFVCI